MKSFLTTLILLIASTATAADPHKFTKANYNEIRRGVGIGHVYVLLGRPDDVTYSAGKYKHLRWRVGNYDEPDKAVYVYLEHDKVTGKMQWGL